MARRGEVVLPDEIKIKIDDAEVQQRLSAMAQRTANLRPLMVRIAGHMLDAVAQNFQSEGRNPKWDLLKPSTIRSRARKGRGPHPILRITGQLARSVSRRATDMEAIVGTNKVYAAIHQFGGEIDRAGRSGSLRLRTGAKGQLLRGKTGGAIFARASHKRGVERSFSIGGHKIRIPPRPFLKLGDDDLGRIRNDVLRHVVQ